MRIYTVHELAGAPADGKGIVFLREGFSVPALVFTVFWLAFARQWLALAFYASAAIALAVLGEWAGVRPEVLMILSLAMQFFLGVSANDIRRWTLERHGYRDIGIAAGRTLEEAERDFFRRWTGHALTVAPTPAAGAPVWPHRPEEHQPLGLFPRAGG